MPGFLSGATLAAKLLKELPLAAILVYDALIVVILLHAILRGRSSPSTIAWMLAIVALPIVGPVLYLSLSSPRVRPAARRRRLAAGLLGARFATAAGDAGFPDLLESEKQLFEMCRRVTGLSPSGGNLAEQFPDNRAAFAEVERVISSATRSVWAEFYIVRGDRTGRRFLELLTERARAGIDVRLLFDAFGSSGLRGRDLQPLRQAGGRALAFLPMNPLRRRWAVHLRNHRKLILADGRTALVGSMNVGDEYSGSWRHRDRSFRDELFRIEGPAALDLARIFAEDWSYASDTDEAPPLPDPPPPCGRTAVALLPSGPGEDSAAVRLGFFRTITSARKSCYVVTPYFIPDEATGRALASAALAGVDVRLLLPEKIDAPLLASASRSFYPRLLKAGVRIFEYRPAILHSKLMAVDGRIVLAGSANLDPRSFWLNFELSALVVDPGLASKVESRFRSDLTQSREVTLASVEGRSLPARLVEGTARLFSPLL